MTQAQTLLKVAPLAGAWIEIGIDKKTGEKVEVAPLAGAWIEINKYFFTNPNRIGSLPSRERGLKFLR